jgi:hypothetical protein
MEDYTRRGKEGKTVFVGVDLHRFKWHVTVMLSIIVRQAKSIDLLRIGVSSNQKPCIG